MYVSVCATKYVVHSIEKSVICDIICVPSDASCILYFCEREFSSVLRETFSSVIGFSKVYNFFLKH